MRATFSGLDTALVCDGYSLLAQIFRPSGAAAGRGTVLHSVFRWCVVGGEQPIVPEQWQDDAMALRHIATGFLAKLREAGYALRSEIAIKINVVTGEAHELGENIGRAYGTLSPYEIAGTLDLIAVSDTEVINFDLKTGEAEPPGTNWQIRAGCIGLQMLYPGRTVKGSIIQFVDNDLRALWSTFEVDDLNDYRATLSTMADRILGAEEDLRSAARINVRQNDKCKWCPSFEHCPAQQRLVRAATSELGTIENLLAKIDDEAAAAAWEWCETIEDGLKRVKEVLKLYAARGSFPIGNGKEVRSIEMVRENVKAGAARALADKIGPDIVLAASTISRASIKRAHATFYVGCDADRLADESFNYLRTEGFLDPVIVEYPKEGKIKK